MTTAQEPPNGHRFVPPPCSLPDLLNQHQSKDSTVNNSNPGFAPASPMPETETFPANAYHFPPKRYTPKPNPYQYDDVPCTGKDTTPLPDRCQFMFSDGRQCTMARSGIHPSLCRYHSEREDQLFGTPGPQGGAIVGRAFDLAELYSACGDLTTAAGVSRALAQVFRLLAQRRISRQEAATFAKLGHLLLQSISAARAESLGAPASQMSQRVEPPNSEGVERGAAVRPFLSHKKDVHPSAPATAPAPCSEPLAEPTAVKNSSGMNTSAGFGCNSREINTYENDEFKPVQNEHLQKHPGMDDPAAQKNRTGLEGPRAKSGAL